MQHYMKQQIPPSRAAQLVRDAQTASVESNPGVPPADIRKALTGLRDSLERFDDAPAQQLLRRLVGVFTPGIVFRDVVLPYLRELGTRWECGEASVAQEHSASCFLEHWMFGFARRPGRPGSRRAVLACVPGEQHSLGLTAFAVVLGDLGWNVTFLGRDVPLGAVRRTADTVAADAIVLATVLPEPLSAAAPDVAEIMHTHSVVVGGPGTERAAVALPTPRILHPDLVGAARSLTLATDGGQTGSGIGRSAVPATALAGRS